MDMSIVQGLSYLKKNSACIKKKKKKRAKTSLPPKKKKSIALLPRALHGGHVCETLLVLAATTAPSQHRISGGISNGVNYNIFRCMGKFRH